MPRRNYILKPTFTSLPPMRKEGRSFGRGDSPDSKGSSIGAVRPAPDPSVRAENEDDDGYDPYSDRREERPLFERSPWD